MNSSEVEGGHSVKFVRLLGISASLMDNFGLLSCTCCQTLQSSKSTSLLVCVCESIMSLSMHLLKIEVEKLV